MRVGTRGGILGVYSGTLVMPVTFFLCTCIFHPFLCFVVVSLPCFLYAFACGRMDERMGRHGLNSKPIRATVPTSRIEKWGWRSYHHTLKVKGHFLSFSRVLIIFVFSLFLRHSRSVSFFFAPPSLSIHSLACVGIFCVGDFTSLCQPFHLQFSFFFLQLRFPQYVRCVVLFMCGLFIPTCRSFHLYPTFSCLHC